MEYRSKPIDMKIKRDVECFSTCVRRYRIIVVNDGRLGCTILIVVVVLVVVVVMVRVVVGKRGGDSHNHETLGES